MGIIIILFFIAIIMAFGMLSFRAWEIKTSRLEETNPPRKIIPEIYFRHIEKIILYSAKYIIQWIVLVVIKGWFIMLIKIKKWAGEKLPKIYNYFKKIPSTANPQKSSFVRKAVFELKTKIHRVKEKVKKEHEG